MTSFSLLATLSVTSAVGLILFFKRRTPELTDEDLDSIPGIPPNVRVSKRGLTTAERDSLKEAFLAGSDYRWLAVGDNHTKDILFDDKKTSEAARKHKKITHYFVEMVVRFAEKYGYVLVFTENPRTNKSEPPGTVLGSLCLVPPYQYTWLYYLHFVRVALFMGWPVTQGMGGGVEERFDAYAKVVEKNHHEIMHGTKHWYIAQIGVSKLAQGRGAGKQLTKAAVAIAGSEPTYLECHDGNVAFYEKMGFRHVRQYEIVVKNDESRTSMAPYTYNAMVCDGTKSN